MTVWVFIAFSSNNNKQAKNTIFSTWLFNLTSKIREKSRVVLFFPEVIHRHAFRLVSHSWLSRIPFWRLPSLIIKP